MGNLGSVKNMFKRVGAKAIISSNIDEIESANKLLLPGVGAFDAAVKALSKRGLIELIKHKAEKEKIPILGICLGMQLLTDKSEEGKLPGLGLIPGSTIKFKATSDDSYKVPHMGWNDVAMNNESSLTMDLSDDSRFYFVHSYFVKVENQANSILKTKYGTEFDSGIQKENIMGVQFHPEKSHKFGMKIFENFAKL